MDIKSVKEILKLLKENFGESLFRYEEEIEETKKIIQVSICANPDSIYYGWEHIYLYFDRQGNLIPNYSKIKDLKDKIKELQEELKELQKEN